MRSRITMRITQSRARDTTTEHHSNIKEINVLPQAHILTRHSLIPQPETLQHNIGDCGRPKESHRHRGFLYPHRGSLI